MKTDYLLYVLFLFFFTSCVSNKSIYGDMISLDNEVLEIERAQFHTKENILGKISKYGLGISAAYLSYESNLIQFNGSDTTKSNGLLNSIVGFTLGYGTTELGNYIMGKDKKKLIDSDQQVKTWTRIFDNSYTVSTKPTGPYHNFYIIKKEKEFDFDIVSYQQLMFYKDAFGVTSELLNFLIRDLKKLSWEDLYKLKKNGFLNDYTTQNDLLKKQLFDKSSTVDQVLAFLQVYPNGFMPNVVIDKLYETARNVEDYGKISTNYVTEFNKCALGAEDVFNYNLNDVLHFRNYFPLSSFHSRILQNIDNYFSTEVLKQISQIYNPKNIKQKGEILYYIPPESYYVVTINNTQNSNKTYVLDNNCYKHAVFDSQQFIYFSGSNGIIGKLNNSNLDNGLLVNVGDLWHQGRFNGCLLTNGIREIADYLVGKRQVDVFMTIMTIDEAFETYNSLDLYKMGLKEIISQLFGDSYSEKVVNCYADFLIDQILQDLK